jgi:hypothetical protein
LRPPGSLFAAADPAAARLAGALAWLWRLGPLLDAPRAEAVGLGGAGDEADLSRLVREGRLAGAAVLAPGLSEEGGDPAGGVVRIGADPDGEWGRFGFHRVLEAVSGYLVERLDRPLVLLPRIGMLRIDDLPGTAQHQLEGRAKTDRRQRRRLRRYVKACRRAGAVLNAAVPAQAFKEGERVPLDRVWPGSISALREGVAQGAVEPVCHGLLHLDTERLEQGAVEFREFANLGEEEAARRIDAAREWQARTLGEGGTFVAPAWAYSEGTLAALAARGIPRFTRCEPGRTYEPGLISETLKGGLGIEGLDYGPLALMAAAGLPPTMVLHGTMIDVRAGSFRSPAELVTAARLFLRRDLSRLPSLEGLRWIGASAYAETLALHDRIVVEDGEASLPPGATARLLDRAGERPVEGPRS